MNTTERFLLAMGVIFSVPYLFWRLARVDFYAPLVVIQIITGILLGPAVLGQASPSYYAAIFSPEVIQALNGIAWWAVMIFVMLAGIELDLQKAWEHRRESTITAGLALGTPLILGCGAAVVLLAFDGFTGPQGKPWQFLLGVGMACAVTALPILILLMEKLDILRQPIGQRILRYASLDDIAIWGVLAVILMDWQRVGRQLMFFIGFVVLAYLFRKLMQKLPASDRWHVALIWLAVCAFGADWSGLHYMVGAFLAGAVIDAHWFDQDKLDQLRHHVLLIVMPVFFLSTGLKTSWSVGGIAVFAAAALLLAASVSGKLLGVHLAGRILKWPTGQAQVIGWLLQTKALIMIIFTNILLDKHIISSSAFSATRIAMWLLAPSMVPRIAHTGSL